jgi:WD40 repeat protein
VTASVVDVENPFPGLRPFEMLESHLFFGREDQVDVLAGRLARSRFVAVVGSSGSGKSSLVRAGLLPALHGGYLSEAGSRWKVAVFRPGDDPIGNLATTLSGPDGVDGPSANPLIVQTTLRRSGRGLAQAWQEASPPTGENLLIVVDQFEELFRVSRARPRVRAREDAAAFVKLLLEPRGQPELRLYVVITMRSDFLGDCSQFRDLPEALNENQYLVPRMTRDQLRSAIAGPVAVGGAEIAPRLVQRVLNDIGDDQDQLPVLQHALMRTWNHWMQVGQDRPVDLEDYEAIGGIEEALSLHAEEAFAELPTERSRDVAQRLFQAITEKAADQSETRRPTRLDDICAITAATRAEIIEVIERFRGGGRAFLMPPQPEPLGAASIVDVSHESLIRQWARLREWVAQETESRETYLRLVDAARLHRGGKGGLWRHPELGLALKWWKERGPNRSWARRYTPESAALGASSFDTARKFLGESEQTRRREQQSRARWFYLTVAGLGVLAVTFFVLFLWAWRARSEAREQASLALARQLAAQSQQIRNEEPAHVDRSVLLAAESLRRISGEDLWLEGGQALQHGLRLLWREAWHFPTDDATRPASFVGLAVSPDGRYAAASMVSDTGRQTSGWVLDMASGKELARFEQAGEMRTLAWSPDGRYVTTGTQVFEALTGQPVARLEQSGRVLAVAFGRTLLVVTGGEDKAARLFEATSGREVLRLSHAQPVAAVAFSPDGRYVATGSWDWTARIVETATARLVAQLEHRQEVEALVWSPDAKYLATGSRDRQVRVFERATGTQVARLGHQGDVVALAFSPNSRYVATGSRDRTARVFEAATGTEVARLGHQEEVDAVAWSPDGRYVATGSRDGTARVFEGTSGVEVARLGHRGQVTAVAFGSKGTRIATASRDQRLDRWAIRAFDVAPHAEAARLAHERPVAALVLSADGRYVATGDATGVTRVLEIASGTEIARLGSAGRVETLAITVDGRRVATGRRDGRVAVFEVPSGRELLRLALGRPSAALAFSPDGRFLATGSGVFEAAAGQQVARLEAEGPVWSLAFSRDGKRLAAGGHDGRARVLEMPSGKEIARITQAQPVLTVALSPDGRHLAVGGDDGSARVFEVASTKELTAFTHRGPVAAVAFGPDGRFVATVSTDGKVRVLDVRSGKPVAEFPHHAWTSLHATAFVREGRELLAAWQNRGNEVVVERNALAPGGLLAQACARVGRNLSAEEWRQYLPAEEPRKTCPNLP